MTRVIATGLGFPEALRWHDGRLWFSDMFRSRVARWSEADGVETVLGAEDGCPEMPGGLGWLPDGRLLVVDCLGRRVLVREDDGLRVHADLAGLTPHPLNDLHVDPDGVAWVGGYGFDPALDAPVPSPLWRIDPGTGDVEPTAAGLVFPNGCERTERGLVVAETFADRVTVLDDRGDPSPLALLPPGSGPDGLSVAPDGRVWVALAFAGALASVEPDGGVTRVLEAGTSAVGSGRAGVYDCAVEPGGRRVAVAGADVDEEVAAREDTGHLLLLDLAPRSGPPSG
ncbi:MAG: SMP-30/gluconolactonase/LRE family protein [Salana multivorans]|nr:SMP-30/gluconolactonase/LRE family protein [Salana multivorans]